MRIFLFIITLALLLIIFGCGHEDNSANINDWDKCYYGCYVSMTKALDNLQFSKKDIQNEVLSPESACTEICNRKYRPQYAIKK